MQDIAITPKIYYLSEQAVTIEFGTAMSEKLLRYIAAINRNIRQNPFPGFIDSVTAYTTISIFYDPLRVIQVNKMAGADCFEKVSGYLNDLLKHPVKQVDDKKNIVTIPVCYGGEYGPDVNDIAKMNRLTPEQVISFHNSATYKVYMMGFAPGFAYLGGMDSRLNSPRKAIPVSAIPAGSIGIAGRQTGIYPFQTPGGWQIIGRTPLVMFDAKRPQPSVLKGEDTVVFKPISKQEFEFLSEQQNADRNS